MPNDRQHQPWTPRALPFLRLIVALALCSTGIALALLGGNDVNVITGTDTSPYVTQNNSVTWGHGDTIVIAYEDNRNGNNLPFNFCGLSVSTDGGETFTRITSPFAANTLCSGDPSVVYSRRAQKWFVSFSAGNCTNAFNSTGQGIRQWSSSDGVNWTIGPCVATAAYSSITVTNQVFTNHTTWVDNNPASPQYGYLYAAFNDNISSHVLYTISTNDGVSWATPSSVNSTPNTTVKMTGSLGSDGQVFIQTMDDRGGGINASRTNYIYVRDLTTALGWAEHYQGPTFFDATFLGPGRVPCSDFTGFTCMYAPGYWQEAGWGQLAVGPNNIVHYFFGARPPDSTDPGDIMYVKSTDGGTTWSIPAKFNTDTSGRAQWNPSVAINAQGMIVVSWYDERNTSGNNLERYARVSLDNGATWGTEMPLSDHSFPVPLRPDSSSFVGRHNHAAFSDDGFGGDAYITWIDGRNSIDGSSQQDIYFDKISLIPPSTFTVTTVADHDDGTCDGSDCTLREAIVAANNHAGKDFITFAIGLTGTIQLTGPLPNISSSMEIQGPGANLISVRRDTGGDYRIFTVDNNTLSGPTVTMKGLTVTNGSFGASGAGIFNNHGKVTLLNCAISGNSGGGFIGGGGIYNNGGTSASASLTLRGCTISGNSSPGAGGGGIYNSASGTGTAILTAENCTFSGNSSGTGGGIYNFGSGTGGGATVSVVNCTFAGNSANGGAIFNDRDTGVNGSIATVTIGNSIFKQGIGANFVSDGTITSLGHNISSDAANGPGGTAPGGYLNGPGDKRNTDPLLDAAGLQNNGGGTLTIGLQSISPAIDGGDDSFAPHRDQRDYFRSGTVDVGAFEFQGGLVGPFTQIVRSGSDILPTCEVVSNHTYRLQSKLNLTDPTWQDVATVPDMTASGDNVTFTDPNPLGDGRRFYHVVLVQ